MNKEKIELNLKQQKFYDKFFKWENIELLWYWWTGKSFVLNYTIDKYIEENKDVKIFKVAPTWIAAMQISWSTIHSTFRLSVWYNYANFQLLSEKEKVIYMETIFWKNKFKIYADIIIFDEISMVSSAVFDYIDYYMRYMNNSNKPFAWKQIIIVWDYWQIPPVIKDNEIESYKKVYWIKDIYNPRVSKVYSKAKFSTITLTKVLRQSDQDFIKKINKVRKSWYIDNNDFIDNELTNWNWLKNHIILAPFNKMVDNINERNYNYVKWNEIIYKWFYSWTITESEADKLTHINLKLKIWIRVLLTKNINIDKWDYEISYNNWDLWTVVSLNNKWVIVKFDRTWNEEYIWIAVWEKNKYSKFWDKEIIWKYKQIPLRLWYWLTFHRVQWMTLDNVILYPYTWNISNRFWMWMNYVALSRCSNLENLKIRMFNN